MQRADAAGGGGEGRGRKQTRRPQRTRGGTLEGRGEGQSLRAVGGRASLSVFFDSATYAKRRGGGAARIRGRRSAALDLAPTFAALSLLFREVLCLLQSGIVCTFLSEGTCRDVAVGVRPESGTGVLFSAKERR